MESITHQKKKKEKEKEEEIKGRKKNEERKGIREGKHKEDYGKVEWPSHEAIVTKRLDVGDFASQQWKVSCIKKRKKTKYERKKSRKEIKEKEKRKELKHKICCSNRESTITRYTKTRAAVFRTSVS
jgi:hypothetical protein